MALSLLGLALGLGLSASVSAQGYMNKVLTEEPRQQMWQLQRQMFRPWQ